MKPDCFKCVHRGDVPSDAHIRCNNMAAKVEGNPHGILNGWFMWPLLFDPCWLVSCDGFSDNPEDKLALNERAESLLTLLALLVGR